jgi:hypothetical protein
VLLPDGNVLVYAHRADDPVHDANRAGHGATAESGRSAPRWQRAPGLGMVARVRIEAITPQPFPIALREPRSPFRAASPRWPPRANELGPAA